MGTDTLKIPVQTLEECLKELGFSKRNIKSISVVVDLERYSPSYSTQLISIGPYTLEELGFVNQEKETLND